MCGITTLLKRALSSRPLNDSWAPEATNRIVGLSDSIGLMLTGREIIDIAPAPDPLQFGWAGAEQSSEILQVLLGDVGDCPVTHTVLDPMHDVIAVYGAWSPV